MKNLFKTPGRSNARMRFARACIDALEPRQLLAGQPDLTFGPDGFARAEEINYLQPDDLVVQSNRKIVAVGSGYPYGGNFKVMRLNEDGTIDQTFDGDGRVQISFGSQSANVSGVELQNDGKIVVSGTLEDVDPATNYSTNVRIGLARLNVDGSLDTTFDDDGLMTIAVPGKIVRANDLKIQADGKILITAGVTEPTEYHPDLTVFRLTTAGALDRTFAGKGYTSDFSGVLAGGSIALLENGRVAVTGQIRGADNFSVVTVAMLRPDGTLDPTFAGTGQKIVTSPFGTSDIASTLIYDTNLRQLVVAGGIGIGSGAYRLNLDGTFDPSFQLGIGGTDDGEGSSGLTGGTLTASGNYAFTWYGSGYRFEYTGVEEYSPQATLRYSQRLAASPEAFAHALATTPDGKLVIGIEDEGETKIARVISDDVHLTINGTTGNDVITFDGDSYTVNGVTQPLDVGAVTDVIFHGLDGDDLFSINTQVTNITVSAYGDGGSDTVAAGNGHLSALYQADIHLDGETVRIDGSADTRSESYLLSKNALNTSTYQNAPNPITFQNQTSVQLDLGSGNDTIDIYNDSIDRPVAIDLGAGDDQLLVVPQNPNTFPFDLIQLTGGAGTDLLSIENYNGDESRAYRLVGADALYLAPSQPPLRFQEFEQLSLTAGIGDDLFDATASSMPVLFVGNSGNDTFLGGAGNDTVAGSDGNDLIAGGPGHDSLDGEKGDDTLLGQRGRDTLLGGVGDDSLAGGRGADNYVFANMSDLFFKFENDLINEQAYPTIDTIDLSAETYGLTIRLNDDTLVSSQDRLVRIAQSGLAGNIENAIGGSGDDLIIGNNLHANLLVGGPGKDTLQGRGGDDTLLGQGNRDVLDGNAGNDVLDGGPDKDTFYAADGATDTIRGDEGDDVLGSSDASDLIENVP